MSFGLNNILKKILPTGLFYRSLIIVAAPTIILQIIITVVFFDSIWIKANKGLTRSLVGELKTLSDIYSGKDSEQIEYLTGQFKFNFDFVINIKDEELPSVSKERKFSPMDRSLRRELKSAFGNSNYWFDTVKYEDVVEIRVKSSDKIIQILFPRERIAPSSDWNRNLYCPDSKKLTSFQIYVLSPRWFSLSKSIGGIKGDTAFRCMNLLQSLTADPDLITNNLGPE